MAFCVKPVGFLLESGGFLLVLVVFAEQACVISHVLRFVRPPCCMSGASGFAVRLSLLDGGDAGGAQWQSSRYRSGV